MVSLLLLLLFWWWWWRLFLLLLLLLFSNQKKVVNILPQSLRCLRRILILPETSSSSSVEIQEALLYADHVPAKGQRFFFQSQADDGDIFDAEVPSRREQRLHHCPQRQVQRQLMLQIIFLLLEDIQNRILTLDRSINAVGRFPFFDDLAS